MSKPIPPLDLGPEVENLWPELAAAFERVVRSGMFINGPETKAFEAEAAAFLGVKHAVGMNSGTDALIIGLRALGVGPGDEVITTPFSFFATAESISIVGAKPVFVDVDIDSMNIDVTLIEAAITSKTKALMPVHLFGRPANMNAILKIAAKHNLKVIEDSAQSFGAVYTCDQDDCDCALKAGAQTGSIGNVGCFSFYPTKNLGAYGDGGLLTTNDDAIAETARKLRDHGSIIRYQNEALGYNSRLDSIQAAILRIKLPHLAEYNRLRREVATRYNEALANTPGVICPEVVPGHVFHQYTIRVTEKDRDEVAAALRAEGVITMVYYPIPQDRLPVYKGQYPTYEKNEVLSKQVLSLPIWPQMDESTQNQVIATLKRVLA